MPWNPEQYERFKSERFAPFQDLLQLIAPRPDLQVCDLGCGTGELSARLQAHLPNSQVLGLDCSLEMLARAQALAHARLSFEQGDLNDLQQDWDLIFSHAALQWVPEHEALLARLWARLQPGGQLAVQMPSNHRHISHRLIQELASQAPFVEALGGWQRHSPVQTIETYAQWLYQLGATEIQVFEKVYPHLLGDAGQVLEWVKGTALVPYLERLPDTLQADFLAAYHQKISQALPEKPVFYAFRRILLSARKVNA